MSDTTLVSAFRQECVTDNKPECLDDENSLGFSFNATLNMSIYEIRSCIILIYNGFCGTRNTMKAIKPSHEALLPASTQF